METGTLYRLVFYAIILALTLMFANYCKGKNIYELSNQPYGVGIIYIFSFIFILLIGFRPIGASGMGDSASYAYEFYGQVGSVFHDTSSKEWFFKWIMTFFANTFGIHEIFFLFVCFIYQSFIVISCAKLFGNAFPIATIFFIGAFSFFSYAVNGIRNGMACSIILLALALLLEKNKLSVVLAILLSYVAYNIHHTTMLPIFAAVIAWFYKNPKFYFCFWFISIGISLIAGSAVTNFFIELGFDDRMTSYGVEASERGFEKSGFRWDFLLYSSVPVLLGYIAIAKKIVFDNNFNFLYATYVICNSFWIMVIRSSFSNRFAYLSWFMFPLLLAYPLLKLDIWGNDQGNKISFALKASTGFTVLMAIVYAFR